MSDSEPVNYNREAFGYDLNKPATLIAGITFAVVAVILSARLLHRRTWWGISLPIGALDFAIAFFLRYQTVLDPANFIKFVMTELLVIASPAAFLAFNYIVYSKLIAAFATGGGRYSLLQPKIVARVFIISDTVTFTLQEAGGCMLARTEVQEAGRIVLLLGIILQFISYVVFYALLTHSHRAFRNDSKFDEYNFPWRLMHVLHFSSVFIIIRAVYRTIEIGSGLDGYLHTHEVFFYVLDTIPLFFATVIYTYYWPAKMIEDFQPKAPTELSSVDNLTH